MSFALQLVVLSCCGLAKAQLSPESLRIDYGAPDACPSESEFRALVASKVRASDRLPEHVFRVRIDKDNLAVLTFEDAEGRPIERRLRGANCKESTTAIALVTALAIDAWVEQKEQVESAAKQADEKPESVSSAGEESASDAAAETSQQPELTEESYPNAEADIPLTDHSVDTALPPLRRDLELGAQLMSSGAHAPGFSWGPAVFAGVRFPEVLVDLRFSMHLLRSSARKQVTKLNYRRVASRIEICPHTPVLGQLTLDLCGLLEVGELQASPESDPRLQEPAAQGILWSATGALLRADVELSRQWYFEVQGGVELPLRTGYEFRFDVENEDSQIVIYRIPPAGYTVGVGLRLSVP